MSWFQKLIDFLRDLFGSGDTAPAPSPTPPQRQVFVAIDAGHGGSDSGAVNQVLGINEKTVTLAISQQLRKALESRGHRVLLTRSTDVFIPLGQRAEIANEAGTDIFVSIHCNSADNTTATGIETYHHPDSANGRVLATKVQEALTTAFPAHQNRGVKSANFQVLRETLMPACLVETEFISNNQQAQFLSTPANQERIATAIVHGIEAYFSE